MNIQYLLYLSLFLNNIKSECIINECGCPKPLYKLNWCNLENSIILNDYCTYSLLQCNKCNGEWCIINSYIKPTLYPTKQQNKQIVTLPTTQPTIQPTTQPTKQPINKPTKQPINKPTKQPINKPTKQPINKPTKQPNNKPTKQPINKPTKQPNNKPTKELFTQIINPTQKPTKQPHKLITLHPTAFIYYNKYYNYILIYNLWLIIILLLILLIIIINYFDLYKLITTNLRENSIYI
jgi:hypothetical protein